jgi:cytochrome c-type biogenesis protein CcmH
LRVDGEQENDMEFWVLATVICGLVAAALALAALHRRGAVMASGNDVHVYRDQLSEVDRDLVRGVIGADEAERLRLEVSRRLLDADKAQSGVAVPGRSSPVLAGLMVVAVFGGAFWLYAQLGSFGQRDLPLETRLEMAENLRLNRFSQAEAEARMPVVDIASGADPALLDLLAKLRVALESRPNDLQGHELLTRNEAGLGDFAAAHRAQRRVLEILGDQASANDFANYADLLALAVDGYVSPEAEAAVMQVLAMDPQSGTGRYYLGLLNAQIGRPDIALGVWRQLLQESLPDAPWVPPIRAQIEFVAADAGVRFELEPVQVGPSADDVEAAADLTDEERDDFIQSMVARLSERLANEGGPASDWARLIGALGVLGDTERATAIWAEAQSVFASSPSDLVALRQAAIRAGIAN